jgi:hypothetical protein
MTETRKSVSDEIEAGGPEADVYRAAVGKTTYDLNVQQYCCAEGTTLRDHLGLQRPKKSLFQT